jgi:type I restriction enzyme, S subunit
MHNDIQSSQLRTVASITMGQSPSSLLISNNEVGTPFLQGNAEFGSLTPHHTLYCTHPKKLCSPGDILISVRAPVGALNKADRAYCIGRGLAAIRFTKVLPRYGWHSLNYHARKLHTIAQGSTFEAINKFDLQSLSITRPADLEQRFISDILDTIDEQIQQTKQLITKLKLLRDGLLHKLLTCGIDEHGQLRDPIANPEQFKDSLIGRIPREWETEKLKKFYAIPARSGLYKSSRYYGRGTLMIHMPQMFRGSTVDPSDAARVEVTSSEYDRFNLTVDDLVFARRSLSFDGAGRCSLIPELSEATTFESSIIRVRLSKDRIQPAFVNQFLNSGIGFRLRTPLIRQVAASGVSAEDIASIPIPYPSLEEQEQILSILRTVDTNTHTEEIHLNKLKLYKTGLMHDLLTGKVRVAEKQEEIESCSEEQHPPDYS